MAGIRDGDEAQGRKDPREGGEVAVAHIGRAAAPHRERRAGIGRARGKIGEARQGRDLRGDDIEIDAPAQSGRPGDQVLHQECAHRVVGDAWLQGGVGRAAPVYAREVERLHRRDLVLVRRRVRHRRDVDHDQALHDLGRRQRQRHRHLAAHAVPDDGGAAEAARGDEARHVLRHLGIGHAVGPGRGAMIAQIEREDMEPRGPAARHRRPVLRRPEEPVQDQDGRAGTVLLAGESDRGLQRGLSSGPT